MTGDTIWTWHQSKGTTLKVISNPEEGTIEVLNEQGEVIIRKTNMSKRQVELVERKFLMAVAKKLNDRNDVPIKKPKDPYDPMIG